jgi:hypothetical protein
MKYSYIYFYRLLAGENSRELREVQMIAKRWREWWLAFKRFLRKENPWGNYILAIGRATPFNPTAFIGEGWSIWRGPINGNRLKGAEEQDRRSHKLTEVDFSRVSFETCLEEGETRITGEEKLKRHESAGHICLDAKVGQALFEEEGHKTLNWLKDRGITWMEFPGTILRSPGGSRCVLALYWGGSGWHWDVFWLVYDWDAHRPSAVLTQ